MLSDFSWDMTGYIPKHAVNPHSDGIIPYAADRQPERQRTTGACGRSSGETDL